MTLVLRRATREDAAGIRELLGAALPANPKVDPRSSTDSTTGIRSARAKAGSTKTLARSCVTRHGPAPSDRHFVFRSGSSLRAAAVVRWDRRGGYVVGDVLKLMAVTADAARCVVEKMAAEADDAVALSFLAPRRTAIARLVGRAGFRAIPHRFESNPLWLNLRDICGDRLDLGGLSWHATSAEMDHL